MIILITCLIIYALALVAWSRKLAPFGVCWLLASVAVVLLLLGSRAGPVDAGDPRAEPCTVVSDGYGHTFCKE